MRPRLVLLAFVFVGAVSTASASAQSALDGPLAPPDSAATKPDAPPRHAKAKPKKVRHAAAKPAAAFPEAPVDDTWRTSGPPSSAESTPGPESPVDPLSLGMKWRGSNDTAAQTRSQNLDGHAFGTGAEVGMKLHF